MLDDKTFLATIRTTLDSAGRFDRDRLTIHVGHLRRLLEMAERWQANADLAQAAADALNPPPSAPSDAMP